MFKRDRLSSIWGHVCQLGMLCGASSCGIVVSAPATLICPGWYVQPFQMVYEHRHGVEEDHYCSWIA